MTALSTFDRDGRRREAAERARAARRERVRLTAAIAAAVIAVSWAPWTVEWIVASAWRFVLFAVIGSAVVAWLVADLIREETR